MTKVGINNSNDSKDNINVYSQYIFQVMIIKIFGFDLVLTGGWFLGASYADFVQILQEFGFHYVCDNNLMIDLLFP